MQGELFNLGGATTIVDASKPAESPVNWLDRFRVTLRLDHLSIVAIFALVLYVLVFSFGVEKGKRIALRELEAQKARQEVLTQELTQVKQVPPVPVAIPKETKEIVAAPIPKAPELPASSIPLTGRFTIQVVTFNTKSRAEQEVKKLKDKGYQSFIISSKKAQMVCVELFEDAGLARQKLTQLKAEGFVPHDAYVRPMKGPVPLI